MDFDFTVTWFEQLARANWDDLLTQISPSHLLEIGSYEGASACYLIEKLGARGPLEIVCVDTWEGGVEHQEAATDMASVEARFDHNIALARAAVTHPVQLLKLKGRSDHWLAQLLADGKRGHFDFIYIDGSHQAPDVLCDAVLAFHLLKVDGVMIFDDYLWSEHPPQQLDPLRCPKPAIDAFVNLHARKIAILRAPLYQLFLRKVAD